MKFEGVDFNSKWAAGVSVEEFIANFRGDANPEQDIPAKDAFPHLSEAQLREAHALCVEAEAPVKKEVAPKTAKGK
jgi:hypothetical protein